MLFSNLFTSSAIATVSIRARSLELVSRKTVSIFVYGISFIITGFVVVTVERTVCCKLEEGEQNTLCLCLLLTDNDDSTVYK